MKRERRTETVRLWAEKLGETGHLAGIRATAATMAVEAVEAVTRELGLDASRCFSKVSDARAWLTAGLRCLWQCAERLIFLTRRWESTGAPPATAIQALKTAPGSTKTGAPSAIGAMPNSHLFTPAFLNQGMRKSDVQRGFPAQRTWFGCRIPENWMRRVLAVPTPEARWSGIDHCHQSTQRNPRPEGQVLYRLCDEFIVQHERPEKRRVHLISSW